MCLTGRLFNSNFEVQILTFLREQNRKAEMDGLLAKGLVPHEIELRNHPEKSLQGLSCESNRRV